MNLRSKLEHFSIRCRHFFCQRWLLPCNLPAMFITDAYPELVIKQSYALHSIKLTNKITIMIAE